MKRVFKEGEEVVYFSKVASGRGTVLAVRDDKVYVDTVFGAEPFDPQELEWADIPF